MASESCYEYALRVAILHALNEERALRPAPPPPFPAAGPSTPSSSSTPTRPPKSSHHDSFRSTFDFASVLLSYRSSSKSSPKYPEKLLKHLDVSLQRIAMGQAAPRFNEHQRFRRACALYWSQTWSDKTWQRQMRESRKVEDLILPFVTTATKSLRKEEELADGPWKEELNVLISMFLEVLSEGLQAVGPVGGELANRLESYRTRLKPDDPPPPPPPPRDSYGGGGGGGGAGDRMSVSDRGHGDRDGGESVRSMGRTSLAGSGEPGRGGLAECVAQLFLASEEQLQAKLRELQGVCTEQAALEDLKTFLKRYNTDSPVPYLPSDFPDPSAWSAWRLSETTALQQQILTMIQSNASLTQSDHRQSNGAGVGDLSSRIDGLKLDAPPQTFTYVPPDPRAAYRELLRRCLDWDLEVLKTLPEDEDVSLGILSQEHVGLLGECAARWRLPGSFRAWVFLDAIVEKCESGDVPVACVHEAMGMVGKVQSEMPMDSWAMSDRSGLERTLARRDLCLLTTLDSALSYAAKGYHSPDFLEAVTDFLALETTLDPSDRSIARVTEGIVEKIRIQAYESYIHEATERLEHEGGKTKRFGMDMGGWVEKEAKRLNKRFGDPVSEKIDIVPLVLLQHLNLWFRDLEDAMAQPLVPGGEQGVDMEEAFTLYRKAQKLLDMGKAFSHEPLHFAFAPIFEGTVRVWLDQTALKTRQWADQALAVDTFEPTAENGPSSSVTDLFDSFRSAADFIMKLDWPDEAQLAYFCTRLAKTFALSINDYCNKMEQLFAGDMSQGDAVQPAQTAAKQKAWIEKAKSTIASLQGERKIQAFFNFTPASCVKLNNIEAARQQLDKLYAEMRVDDLAAYETSTSPVLPADQQTYLFTVKIVLAEGISLDAASGSSSGSSSKLPDSFVILSDEHGNRYAKTRTIYDDADPRWDETFDIPVRGSAWFMATVRHRALAGKHDLLGRAYLRLDPSQYADLISKDVLLPLDSRGHLLFRISMEGERDDIQFHFGRAFRWLKRTEADMVRTFVDKMTPVLRHTLSRASIKSVLKPGGNIPINLDYNEALTKLSTAYRNAMGANDYSIPLPASEKPLPKRGPSDAEIESAIHPLFDYLETNISTLAHTLSRDAMSGVMSKLWKQILMTIEALIVPPLSDKPSHMRALSDGELDVALKWLKFLRDFFYAGGDESGVPLSTLQNAKYDEILRVRMYYDWNTDDLMEECIRGFQSTLKYKATRPSKSLMSQRNLGTIRARKSAKRAMPASGGNTEMIMRILRMRQGTQEFLAQQIQTISVVKLENPGKAKRSLNHHRPYR